MFNASPLELLSQPMYVGYHHGDVSVFVVVGGDTGVVVVGVLFSCWVDFPVVVFVLNHHNDVLGCYSIRRKFTQCPSKWAFSPHSTFYSLPASSTRFDTKSIHVLQAIFTAFLHFTSLFLGLLTGTYLKEVSAPRGKERKLRITEAFIINSSPISMYRAIARLELTIQ